MSDERQTSEASAAGGLAPATADTRELDGIRARGLESPTCLEETDEKCAACEGTGAEMALDEAECGCLRRDPGCDCLGSGVRIEPRPRRLRPISVGEEFINAALALDDLVSFDVPLDKEPFTPDAAAIAAWDRFGRAIAALRSARPPAVQPAPERVNATGAPGAEASEVKGHDPRGAV